MRIVFMGTAGFACPSLRALVEAGHQVSLVITQPDRPAGRGQEPTPPPVRVAAEELGLEVWQPASVKDPAVLERLTAIQPQVIVVVAYGQFIPRRIRHLPPHRCLNVHASMLPLYRGAAPVRWAVARGEAVTGVTIMRLVRRLDAGPILKQRGVAIGPHERAGELTHRLADVGAELLCETLEELVAGTIEEIPQDEEQATYAPILKKGEGLIDWSRTPDELYAWLRGMDPWPGLYTFVKCGRKTVRLEVLELEPLKKKAPPRSEPGQLLGADDGLLVACGGEGIVRLTEVKPAGKRAMSALDFQRGRRLEPGARFGDRS